MIQGDQQNVKYTQEELNKSGTDACLNNSLDFVICTIREIRESPAGICQDFFII